eukprot:CAMPEP_0178932404 /NCGR_PEP_ID=MMETSP0786-20121207/22574_1 /TAXON_ID=186022 /ORGANISM="Thalassionema frauenfeldii, Strain CCMP 1798" /LENGTH=117 /DNA_ID=CAMNT_0020609643 /DNA_START=11 /DNA_END=361 /DNA_ORIENTATION=-
MTLLKVLVETHHAHQLPPKYWPSAQPLLSLLLGGMSYFCFSQLLPRWFPAMYQVYLTHRPISSFVEEKNNDEANLAVLVNVPRELQVYASPSQRKQTICPLHKVKTSSKKKKKKKKK